MMPFDNPNDYIGKEFWFEYHCWESHKSSDAQAWYKSHQRVIVLSLCEETVVEGMNLSERYETGHCCVFRARWEDGFEWDVWEDELCENREDFHRPDPPIPQSSNSRR